ncbi:hypothetical protein N9242_05900 [Vicingaceae bacterium]|nr:hypothetical protein [Vicingaceae bacterium]
MSRARDTADQINRVNSSAADATAITVDSSENVMIGTTVAGRASEGADRLTIADASHSGMTIRSGENAYGSINFSDSEGGAGEYAGQIWYGHGSLGEKLVMAIQGSNKVTVDGDGLKFNNDTAAANALNDYEEGTWTPTVTVGAVSSVSGEYTKIGRTVHITATLGNFSNTVNNEKLLITSLPFTASVTARAIGGAMWSDINKDFGSEITFIDSSSRLSFYQSDNGSFEYLRHIHLDGSSSTVYLYATYKTNA